MTDPSADLPRLYTDLAGWFHLLTAPSDYAEEAARYRDLLDETGRIRTVLELGSGGGNNASHLKAHYELTLTDRAQDMLELSLTLNPECEHLVGDMRTLRLGRTFDAVFAHDAIAYLTNLDDLAATFATAAAHLEPGGVALFCPDDLVETFTPATRHGGHDDGSRGLRYLEWSYDPDPTDHTCVTDMAYLLRDGDRVEVVHDRHLCGLFGRDQWTRGLAEAGFVDIEVLRGAEDGYEVFRAIKAA